MPFPDSVASAYRVGAAKRARRSTALLAGTVLATPLLLMSPRADASFPGGDGRIFVAASITGQDCGAPDYTHIASFSPVGGRPRAVANGFGPSVSPLGGRLAYVSGGNPDAGYPGNVYVQRIGHRRATRVTHKGDVLNVAWGPDGRHLVLGSARGALSVMRADGRGRHLLTRARSDADPAWSSANRIAFDRSVAPRVRAIFTMTSEGGDVRRVTFGHHVDLAPDWSPDGRAIVFVRGSGDVYVVRSDGSGLRRLVAGAQAQQAVWAPDGRQIAYADYTDLFVINADGTHRRHIAEHEDGAVVDLAWQPLRSASLSTRATRARARAAC